MYMYAFIRRVWLKVKQAPVRYVYSTAHEQLVSTHMCATDERLTLHASVSLTYARVAVEYESLYMLHTCISSSQRVHCMCRYKFSHICCELYARARLSICVCVCVCVCLSTRV